MTVSNPNPLNTHLFLVFSIYILQDCSAIFSETCVHQPEVMDRVSEAQLKVGEKNH